MPAVSMLSRKTIDAIRAELPELEGARLIGSLGQTARYLGPALYETADGLLVLVSADDETNADSWDDVMAWVHDMTGVKDPDGDVETLDDREAMITFLRP